MTKIQKEKLETAKDEALKNPPVEIVNLVVSTRRSKEKKSSNSILMEMRYNRC